MSPQPPAPDPLGRDLPEIVISALGFEPDAYEQAAVRRLVLYSDRADVQLLASLIKKAREQAAGTAIAGTLFE